MDRRDEPLVRRRSPTWCSSAGSACSAGPRCCQLRGDWDGALEEIRRALTRLQDPPNQVGLGSAYFQLGELHRLRGELDEADEAYRQASQHGRRVQPGLALLRLAQGDIDTALASIRRALEESPQLRFRPMLLAACVEVAIAGRPRSTWLGKQRRS